jgi:hypothetical protein
MTVNELIAELSALSPEERELPVLLATFDSSGQREWDPEVTMAVDEVNVWQITYPREGFPAKGRVRALLLE